MAKRVLLGDSLSPTLLLLLLLHSSLIADAREATDSERLRGVNRNGPFSGDGGKAKGARRMGGSHSAAVRESIVSQARNCTELIYDPVDSHPVRSPQAVHSAITRHLAGVELVEIGTRGGDGMACFAQVTKTATAVEMDEKACKKLEKRSQTLGSRGNRTFSIRCNRYQSLELDGDVFTWWQQEPHLKNAEVLRHLRRQQQAGRIRPSAQAILLFENGYHEDMRSFAFWRNSSAWIEEVPFDEQKLCRMHYRQPWFRKRAKGFYHVMGLRVADVTV